MNATEILGAIARRHSGAALLREIVLEDPTAAERSEADCAAWWERHRERGNRTDPADPWPEQPWTRRIDGLLLDGNQTSTAIEVKVSRSDFLRETSEKRAPWRAVTNRFVYAVPAGLLRPDEMPDGCGLWEIDDSGAVTVAKSARRNKEPDPIPQRVLVALAYRLKAADR